MGCIEGFLTGGEGYSVLITIPDRMVMRALYERGAWKYEMDLQYPRLFECCFPAKKLQE